MSQRSSITYIDAHPRPSRYLLHRWAFVDGVAFLQFGRPWKRLKDREKTRVMESINGAGAVSVMRCDYLKGLLRQGETNVQKAAQRTSAFFHENPNAEVEMAQKKLEAEMKLEAA